MFNPHAPLDLFCFVFSCSLFFALSPVYLNAWNRLFGYDSVNNVKLFAKKRLKMCPVTQYFISSWFTKRFRRISLHTFTGLLPHTQKRFHNTVEALAQLVLFMVALIKLLIKFLISTKKKNSHMRLTPVTNTYPVYHCFSLSGFICEQTCLFIDRSTVPSICHLPLSNNIIHKTKNEMKTEYKPNRYQYTSEFEQ